MARTLLKRRPRHVVSIEKRGRDRARVIAGRRVAGEGGDHRGSLEHDQQPAGGGGGTAVGLLTSCWDVGLAIAGPLGGLAAHAAGLGAPFALAAVAAMLAGLPLATVSRIVARQPTH